VFNKSVLTCDMDPRPWWAPDQPGFVCGGGDENRYKCIGWNGVPTDDQCSADFDSQCRVCRCVGKEVELPVVGPSPGDPGTGDHGPWGEALFGHTAANGGVYSTMRIPFGSKIRATLTSKFGGTFWFIIRGIENYPVQLGDLTLPAAARLRLHRFQNSTVNNQLVTLANIASGTAGALFMTRFDASNPKSYGYLEACMRAMIDGATSPLFLSSGAEDYFLSAYYFNQGNFKTPESGLTYFDGHGTLSVYKIHDRDPVLWNNGFQLIFRNCETTTGCGDLQHCPNQFCAPNASAVDLEATATDGWHAPPLKYVAEGLTAGKGSTDAEYKTAVWTYEWPASAEKKQQVQQKDGTAAALAYVVALGAEGLLTEAVERNLVVRLSRGDAALASAVAAYGSSATSGDARQRAARIISGLA